MDSDGKKYEMKRSFGQHNCMPKSSLDRGLFDNPNLFKVSPFTVIVTTSKKKMKKNYIEGGSGMSRMMYMMPLQPLTGRTITTLIFDDTIVPGLKDALSFTDLMEWLQVIINPLLANDATVIMEEELSRTKYYLEEWCANRPAETSLVIWDD